jgi:hypothetical protein
MRQILATVEARARAYGQHPLFAFLSDSSIRPADRLGFAPALSHFVMSFADVYRLVLRDESRSDLCSRVVNAHTHEDGDHWRWFLQDLKKLGYDRPQTLTETLDTLWSDVTAHVRMLTYRVCQLGLDASPLQKLVLVESLEAAGKLSLTAAVPTAQAWGEVTGETLIYLGAHHADTEQMHTVEQPEIAEAVRELQVEPEARASLLRIVEQTFTAFEECATALLRFAESQRASAESQRASQGCSAPH